MSPEKIAAASRIVEISNEMETLVQEMMDPIREAKLLRVFRNILFHLNRRGQEPDPNESSMVDAPLILREEKSLVDLPDRGEDFD